MNDRFLRSSLVVIVLLATSLHATPLDAQEPTGSSPAGAIEFDAKKIASTIGRLSKPHSVEFEQTALKDVLWTFASKPEEVFQNNTSPVIVTFKATGSFGEILGDLLGSAGCDYAILPNGKIEIRNKPDDKKLLEKAK